MFYDDFFNNFFGISNLAFNNYTLDQKPVTFKKTDTGYKAICRTVGVNPDDVKVESKSDGICVSGETVVGDETYNAHYTIHIKPEIFCKIKGINYTSDNGITTIYIDLKESQPQFEINKI